MRTLKFLLVISLVASSMTSCDTTAKGTLPGRTWKIYQFIQAGDDDTDQYDDYTFYFKGNGQLIIKKETDETLGYWYINNNNGERVIISIPGNFFEALNDAWYVISSDGITVELENKNTEPDKLTFRITG